MEYIGADTNELAPMSICDAHLLERRVGEELEQRRGRAVLRDLAKGSTSSGDSHINLRAATSKEWRDNDKGFCSE
jgi:hypothetical protein